MASKTRRLTRKHGKGKVLNVRSHSAVKAFEKHLSNGPLTLVYVNAKWCGACHRFNDEVWGPLTKLKNKSVNLASVDSEMIGKTSLANVPRKFFPTLMLVGKDKKPATFEDEEGNPTNAMPRNNTLSEDREALSNLVQNPTVKPSMGPMAPSMGPMAPSMGPMAPSMKTSKTSSMNFEAGINSPPRANVSEGSLAKSPYEAINGIPTMDNSQMNSQEMSEEKLNKPSRTVNTLNMNNTRKNTPSSRKIPTSLPPRITDDLVSSQTKSPTPTAGLMPEPIKGGTMLKAIRDHAASIKSMLSLRKQSTRRR